MKLIQNSSKLQNKLKLNVKDFSRKFSSSKIILKNELNQVLITASGVEVKVGKSASISKTFTNQDVEKFAELSLDNNPLHLDENFAKDSIFKKRIAHGLLSASLLSGVLGMKLPGIGSIYLSQSLRFVKPVFIGDTITATVTITKLNIPKKIATAETKCVNQNGEVVLTGEAMALIPVKSEEK